MYGNVILEDIKIYLNNIAKINTALLVDYK